MYTGKYCILITGLKKLVYGKFLFYGLKGLTLKKIKYLKSFAIKHNKTPFGFAQPIITFTILALSRLVITFLNYQKVLWHQEVSCWSWSQETIDIPIEIKQIMKSFTLKKARSRACVKPWVFFRLATPVHLMLLHYLAHLK